MAEITNQDRFWFIIFALWCLKYGKIAKQEDFNQLKFIPEEEFEDLRQQAIFQILKTGWCPCGWADCGKGCIEKLKAEEAPHEWSTSCKTCKTKFTINGATSKADVVEDE